MMPSPRSSGTTLPWARAARPSGPASCASGPWPDVLAALCSSRLLGCWSVTNKNSCVTAPGTSVLDSIGTFCASPTMAAQVTDVGLLRSLLCTLITTVEGRACPAASHSRSTTIPSGPPFPANTKHQGGCLSGSGLPVATAVTSCTCSSLLKAVWRPNTWNPLPGTATRTPASTWPASARGGSSSPSSTVLQRSASRQSCSRSVRADTSSYSRLLQLSARLLIMSSLALRLSSRLRRRRYATSNRGGSTTCICTPPSSQSGSRQTPGSVLLLPPCGLTSSPWKRSSMTPSASSCCTVTSVAFPAPRASTVERVTRTPHCARATAWSMNALDTSRLSSQQLHPLFTSASATRLIVRGSEGTASCFFHHLSFPMLVFLSPSDTCPESAPSASSRVRMLPPVHLSTSTT
mmetsp:Transcript_29829/g.75957  ORF Transcript_29829/g.75957 Transcript_29829/m.75957 type:complete len:406 (-) Transcript_29829:1684-2901(-)